MTSKAKIVKLKFNQEDFSERNYKKILTKINTKTIFYDEIKSNNKFTLWRHDLDFSVHRAYSLAKIEKKFQVKATYFLYLGCFYYNVFDQEIKNLILKILRLGHQLGLHFDATLYNIKSPRELENYLTFEKKILENLFQNEIKVFSFHNPRKEIFKFDNFKYAKMINTSSKYFKKHVGYCSDSNGYWRNKKLTSFLDEKNDKIQVLTHPGWWQKNPSPPYLKVKRTIFGRAEKLLINYNKNLKKNKRKNIKYF